jgi:hypothetical protein
MAMTISPASFDDRGVLRASGWVKQARRSCVLPVVEPWLGDLATDYSAAA